LRQIIQLTERLVRRCQRGDERARYALYKQFVGGMYNVAYRIVGNQFDAEEVVQDAFVKAFNKMTDLKDVNAFAGWLKQIVVNQAISLIRKQNRLQVSMESIDELPDIEEEQIDLDWPMQMVMEAVMALPEGARVVFSLRIIEGYKFNEIAQITGQTVNNCKVQFHRSKKLLSAKLKK